MVELVLEEGRAHGPSAIRKAGLMAHRRLGCMIGLDPASSAEHSHTYPTPIPSYPCLNADLDPCSVRHLQGYEARGWDDEAHRGAVAP